VCVAAQSNAVTTVSNALGTNAAALTATNTNAAASTAARTAAKGGNEYLGLIIWGVVIAAVFGFLWSKGYLVKIRNYIEETQEELKKCSWPNREELKGSTVVVMVTITMLGLFTVGVDWLLASLMRLIT
jgi:preprotein translocase SecE subunit